MFLVGLLSWKDADYAKSIGLARADAAGSAGVVQEQTELYSVMIAADHGLRHADLMTFLSVSDPCAMIRACVYAHAHACPHKHGITDSHGSVGFSRIREILTGP